MHPTPGFRHQANDVAPSRVDAGGLAKARQTISSLAHPHTRPIVDTAMGTLHAALSGGGLQVSKIPGLQIAVRKHVRQAWTDGIIAPLARSRHPAAREVLDAMPKDFAMKAHAEVLAVVERIARGIPEDAVGTREHVARAMEYLEALPLILRALVDVEGVASGARTGRPSDATGPADLPGALALAQRRARAALSPHLASLVEELADRVYRGPLGATGNPGFRWTAAALLAPPARGARKSDRGGPQWRRGLAKALSRDLVDEALVPDAGRLLRRHAGLEVGDASYAPGGGHGGRLDLALSRAGVGLVLSVGFDAASGRFERRAEAVSFDGARTPLALEDADALLDASVPGGLDTPAHRAMRRLSRRDDALALHMHVNATGELQVAPAFLRDGDAGLLEGLLRAADEEGSAVRFDPVRDLVLASGLVELDFEWHDGSDGRCLVRAPAGPARRPGA
ncbi:hypothetical protein [Methylobacterium oryzae]|uniref:DUF222 domain-containing protein n=1 Tax=Methylobacterium oryzae TaxID=334852 RepID=A0ABU7TL57_9HYPH